jgi:hypothetical protein
MARAVAFEANAAARFYEKAGAVRIGAKEREIGGARLPLLLTDGQTSRVAWLAGETNDRIRHDSRNVGLVPRGPELPRCCRPPRARRTPTGIPEGE